MLSHTIRLYTSPNLRQVKGDDRTERLPPVFSEGHIGPDILCEAINSGLVVHVGLHG